MRASARLLQRIALAGRHLNAAIGHTPPSGLVTRATHHVKPVAMSAASCCELNDTGCWSASLTTAAAIVAQLDAAAAATVAATAQQADTTAQARSMLTRAVLCADSRCEGQEEAHACQHSISQCRASPRDPHVWLQQDGATAPPPQLPPQTKTFYKRTLPSPPAIAFSSPEGRLRPF